MPYIVTKATFKVSNAYLSPGSFLTVSEVERLALVPAFARDATNEEIVFFTGQPATTPNPEPPLVMATDTILLTRGGNPKSLTISQFLTYLAANIPGAGSATDTRAPVVTSPAIYNIAENASFEVTLAADETVTWAKSGGADAALFGLSGAKLTLSARDYETPTDSDGDNVYRVNLTATDAAGNVTTHVIAVTVTNVLEGTLPVLATTTASINTTTAAGTVVADLPAKVEGETRSFLSGSPLAIDNRLAFSTAGKLIVGAGALSAGTINGTIRQTRDGQNVDTGVTITVVGASAQIISASVRTKMPISQGAAISISQKVVGRIRHKSNHYVDDPWLEYYHGQLITTGAIELSLQRGFANSDRAVSSAAVAGTTMTLTMETTRGYKTGDVVTVRNNAVDFASGAITIASDTTATLTVANGTAAPTGTVVCRNPYYRIQRRAALITGISGVGQDQSAGTLTKLTWFGMLQDSAFVAAGGEVSSDGYTLTVPNGFRYRTDRVTGFRLPAGRYYIQEEYRAFATGDIVRSVGLYGRGADFGEYGGGYATDVANDLVFAKNWSGASGISAITAAASGPCAVLGTGPAGVKCVLVDGDSIICEAGQSARTNGADLGDDDDALGPVKRALNAAGYSFLDVSVSGTNIGNQMSGYDQGANGLRRVLAQYCDAVITDHGHNDRRSGIQFEGVGNAAGSMLNVSGNGLRVLYRWHNDYLRSVLRGPKRVVRTTLLPGTTSTDAYATTANQNYKNDDTTWVSDYATSSNGDQFKFNDMVMRRGLYASLAYSGSGECDAGWDFYAASGHTADGKFAPGTTNDGTHQYTSANITAANDLIPKLPTLLGFAAAA